LAWASTPPARLAVEPQPQAQSLALAEPARWQAGAQPHDEAQLHGGTQLQGLQ